MSNTFEGGWYKQFMHDMASSVEEDIKNKLHSLGWVRLDEVISEHESQLRFLKEEGEVAAYTYGFIEAHIEYLKEKYGVK